jgi:hypothetical protein
MKVPYKLLATGHEKPLLPITIRNPQTGNVLRLLALVDSGSDTCFFDAELAIVLGIKKVGDGKRVRVYGAVPGKWEFAFQHPIEIEAEGKRFAIEAGFMRGLSHHGFGILGQRGFFDQVQAVTFEKKKGVFEVVV